MGERKGEKDKPGKPALHFAPAAWDKGLFVPPAGAGCIGPFQSLSPGKGPGGSRHKEGRQKPGDSDEQLVLVPLQHWEKKVLGALGLMILLRKQDRKIGAISSEIPKTPSSLRPFHPQQKQAVRGDSGVPRAACVREGIQPLPCPREPGGSLWEPPHTPSSPFLPLTSTTVGRGWRGRWHRALLKQIHSRKRPCACFPSNCDVTRDVWAFVLHSPPFFFFLLKGKRKRSRKRRGAGDSLLATWGQQWPPAGGTWLGHGDSSQGMAGWGRVPGVSRDGGGSPGVSQLLPSRRQPRFTQGLILFVPCERRSLYLQRTGS